MSESAPFDDELYNGEYVNARYAPTGDQKVGDPFPLFKQPAYYFTDWAPSSQGMSNLKKKMNLPTNNTLFRNTQSSIAVPLQNKQNINWVSDTQTVKNVNMFSTCSTDGDCNPGEKCNSNFQNWSDAFGNQGNYCVKPQYPELQSGRYQRTLTAYGGIGKKCNSDNDCGAGYSCNQQTDIFGKNIQQTGFCAQTYECPNGTHYLGYPYNASTPVVPPASQNNNGKGYTSKKECESHKLAMQDCVRDNSGNWFATYPGFCPLQPTLRKDDNPMGALPRGVKSSEGFVIPAYATNLSSSMGKANKAFASWNINSSRSNDAEMSEPLRYELRINPKK